MSSVTSFQDQKQQDGKLTIQAMAIQLATNLAISAGVVYYFSFFRPKYPSVYAPKENKHRDVRKNPPKIENSGLLAWLKPLDTTFLDDLFIERFGEDATMFLFFLRQLRSILLPLTAIGCGLMIVNVLGTKFTGDWPPTASLEIISMSGINYHNGQLKPNPNTQWYIAHTVAVWLVSCVVGYYMYDGTNFYIDMRQKFFKRLADTNADDDTSKALLIRNIPSEYCSRSKLEEWFTRKNIQIEDVIVPPRNSELEKLYEEYNEYAQKLETTMSAFLRDGKEDLETKSRPMVRIKKKMYFFGGEKVDAINYYTEEAKKLRDAIDHQRHRSTSRPANYGWAFFPDIGTTHESAKQLQNKHKTATKNAQVEWDVRLAPPQNELIWSNLSLGNKLRRSKRLLGRVFFWIFVFVWMLPIGVLSATSNLVNLVRLFPNANIHIDDHGLFMSMFQSYFTPILMAIFFIVLPILFRFISKQQGYLSESTLDRKVFTKLYVFFIINNLLIFTLSSMMISIFGQVKSLIVSGSLLSDVHVSDYATQLAKNISDVSTYWVNYVCIKGLGLTMELAQVAPLITITLKKWFTRPSPGELEEITKQKFDYPGNYNILMFFFTIALVYSVISPLVLPFAYVYFVISSVVYKYMLMYVYSAERESGGQMWPSLFQAVMTSVILFQVIMIIILNLKGGHDESYALIPLPILTLLFQYISHQRMSQYGAYLTSEVESTFFFPKKSPHAVPQTGSKSNSQVAQRQKVNGTHKGSQGSARMSRYHRAEKFQDPALHAKLAKPRIHEDVQHLLPKVYENRDGGYQHNSHEDNKSQQTAGIPLHDLSLPHRTSMHRNELDMLDMFSFVKEKDPFQDFRSMEESMMHTTDTPDERYSLVQNDQTSRNWDHTQGSYLSRDFLSPPSPPRHASNTYSHVSSFENEPKSQTARASEASYVGTYPRYVESLSLNDDQHLSRYQDTMRVATGTHQHQHRSMATIASEGDCESEDAWGSDPEYEDDIANTTGHASDDLHRRHSAHQLRSKKNDAPSRDPHMTPARRSSVPPMATVEHYRGRRPSVPDMNTHDFDLQSDIESDDDVFDHPDANSLKRNKTVPSRRPNK